VSPEYKRACPTLIFVFFNENTLRMSKKKTIRQNWGKVFPENLPKLDLIAILKESYSSLLEEEIPSLLKEVFPIEDYTGKNWRLSYSGYHFEEPSLTDPQAQSKGLSFTQPLYLTVTLKNLKTEIESTEDVFIGDIPVMTERGTFIVNGVERCIISQLIRAPGVYFTGEQDSVTGRMLYQAEIRPVHGSWLEFAVGRNDVITARIDRRRKFPATTLLRAMGETVSDAQLNGLFGDIDNDPDHQYIKSTINKDTAKTYEEGILDVYKRMRPGEPAVFDTAQDYFHNTFFDPRRYTLNKVGRFKINKKLELDIPETNEFHTLQPEDVTATLRYLVQLQNGIGEVDDIDHLANRRVRRVGELVSHVAFRVGLFRMERIVKERMSLAGSKGEITPTDLVNARPLMAVVNDFFRTNQLSSIVDQTNPLSELDNLRRLTVMGPGGITRERASFSIRDIHSSQYGRICPVRSPEGPNIGLVTYASLFAKIDEYGFLLSPYRKVEKQGNKMKITEEVVYLRADDEEHHHLTHASVEIDENNYITQKRVPARFEGEFIETDVTNIEYIDLVPRQVVGVAASLIPFIAHDEAIRALMGTNMQSQAVPLLRASSPVVGTGMEAEVPLAMGRVIRAPESGTVEYVDATKLIMKYKSGKKEYDIAKFTKTAQSTTFTQKPAVIMGEEVDKGQVIVDGPACEEGELALGQNLIVAYMSYEGLEYEDAVVVSDRLVREDLLTSVNIEEYEAQVVETKLGPEETTRDIPNVGEEALANLDEDGIIIVGAEAGPSSILVGKIAPKGATELTAEERMLRAIFGEKARDVRDTSLRMPHGERGVIIDVKVLDRDGGDELEPGVMKKIIVQVAQIRKVTVGDKLAGRHGNKGVISKVVPRENMPYLEDGTAVDIIISPLSVLSRMNLGQLMEVHLGWAAGSQGFKVGLPVFEKVEESRMTDELRNAGLPLTGKAMLRNGKTGDLYEQPITVGVGYVMKLIHMVEDKIHARSTGPYSLVTQQPLGGKAQMGGQRLGEMEVWALEAHKAAHTLQEMLTIKSDDVVGRAQAFEAIVKGTTIPEAEIPESFKVLIKELQALGLSVDATDVKEEQQDFSVPEEKVEDVEKLKAKISDDIVDDLSDNKELKEESEEIVEEE